MNSREDMRGRAKKRFRLGMFIYSPRLKELILMIDHTHIYLPHLQTTTTGTTGTVNGSNQAELNQSSTAIGFTHTF